MSKLLKQLQDAKHLLADNQVNLYYDPDLALQFWKDFRDLYSGYMHVFKTRNGADYIVFGDMERSPFNASDLKARSKYELEELYGDLFGRGHRCGMTKDALIEELMGVTTLGFYKMIYTNRTWLNLDSTYTLPGHSQGDAIKVLVLDTMPEGFHVPSKDYLHNLIFDNPINGTIRFKGVDYDIDEWVEDPYQYDKEQIIVRASEAFTEHEDRKEVVAFLTAMLPFELLPNGSLSEPPAHLTTKHER